MPVWAKLTPATSDIAIEAAAVFRGGADAVVSSNTFPSLPLIDPDSLEFEMNVDGLVSSGGLGGPAILPLSIAKMAQMTQAFEATAKELNERVGGNVFPATLEPAITLDREHPKATLLVVRLPPL